MSEPKVILYQPPGHPWGLPNLSPFCTKLEGYLRMAGIPYETRPANYMKAPKGKVPYVDLGGRLMGDSQLIIEHLEQTRDPPLALDWGLSPEQRATGHAVRRMLEEGLYFAGMHLRWERDDGFALLKPVFRKLLPLGILLTIIRRKVRKLLKAQGTGRHSDAEIQAIGKADITALATLLADRPFFLGPEPRTCDATIYAFIESIGGFPLDSEVKRHLLAQPNLIAYRDRIRARYWA